VSKYHCSACGVELTPWTQTPCPNSESGLHPINDEDFKAHKIEQQKEWERLQVEAGVPTFEPSADEMLDWLQKKREDDDQFTQWCIDLDREEPLLSFAVSAYKARHGEFLSLDIREAIRAAMKAEEISTTSRPGIHAAFLCPQCKQRAVTPHRCDKDGPGEYVVAFVRDPVVRRPPVFLDPRDFEDDEEADR